MSQGPSIWVAIIASFVVFVVLFSIGCVGIGAVLDLGFGKSDIGRRFGSVGIFLMLSTVGIALLVLAAGFAADVVRKP